MQMPDKENVVVFYGDTDVGTIEWVWMSSPYRCWRMWIKGHERVWYTDIDPKIIAESTDPAEVVADTANFLVMQVRHYIAGRKSTGSGYV